MTQVVLAIDPGRRKFGYAVLKSDTTVLSRGIALVPQVKEIMRMICAGFPVTTVVVGDKTGSREILDSIEQALQGRETVVCRVDEAYSTMEGRRRYLQEHRRGWRRLVPLGLQVPPEPYDDYVAVILGERFLRVTTDQRVSPAARARHPPFRR